MAEYQNATANGDMFDELDGELFPDSISTKRVFTKNAKPNTKPFISDSELDTNAENFSSCYCDSPTSPS